MKPSATRSYSIEIWTSSSYLAWIVYLLPLVGSIVTVIWSDLHDRLSDWTLKLVTLTDFQTLVFVLGLHNRKVTYGKRFAH